ncbi:MAG: hypothetical protein V9E81_07175 [Marmoricola sp.]
MSVEAGLVSVDSALGMGLSMPGDLFAQHDACGQWPGQQRVHLVLRWMDGRSGSAGETRGRYLFKKCGLPIPDLQFRVSERATGRLLGITDYWWERARVFGEFDGRIKYGRLMNPGEEPGDVVFREKRREDLIRAELNARCFRLTWADLDRPKETGQRLADMLGVRPLWKRIS